MKCNTCESLELYPDKTINTINNEFAMNMIDQMFCGVISLNSSDEIIFFNTSASNLLGLNKSEVINKNIFKVEKLSKVIPLLKNEHEGRYIVEIDNDNYVYNMKYVKYNDGEQGVLFVFHKSNDSNCLIQELHVTSEILRETNVYFDSSIDGIIVSDKNGVIQKINKAYLNMHKGDEKDYIGKHVKEIMKRENFNKSSILRAIEEKKPVSEYITKGNLKIIASANPVYDENGEIDIVLAIIRDISEIERLKNELVRQQKLNTLYSSKLAEKHSMQKEFPELIMNSKRMMQVMDTVKIVSEFDTSILITGHSGVGKEVVANYIHRLSDRKKKPMVKINCGAIPEGLFESEMFGYVEGSFTGAKEKGKKGFFEQAQGGTLLLDEIGEISMDMQVKLLRAIQEKEIQPIGSEKTIAVDVRIIAATNKSLDKLVQEGRYREDLYYRLNVINIHIDSLLNRPEDIIPLAEHFLKKLNYKYGKKRYFSIDLYDIFLSYDWPGNIRELENLVEYLMVVTKSDEILSSLLPEKMNSLKRNNNKIKVTGIMPIKEAFEKVEKELFLNALRDCKSAKEIAERLGVNQSTVSRKLKHYNLD